VHSVFIKSFVCVSVCVPNEQFPIGLQFLWLARSWRAFDACAHRLMRSQKHWYVSSSLKLIRFDNNLIHGDNNRVCMYIFCIIVSGLVSVNDLNESISSMYSMIGLMQQ
jgi:hypothetical protein